MQKLSSFVPVIIGRFVPDMEEDELEAASEWIGKVRGQYGKANTLMIGSFDPAAALEAVRNEEDPAEALAQMLTEAGYDMMIPNDVHFTKETIALCAELEEKGIAVPAANVYYDGTDGIHEAGENVFEPYAVRKVSVTGFIHKMGILTLYCRGEGEPDEPGFLFTNPDNEEGTLAEEAAIYLKKMQEDGCEFIVVCCYGEPEITEDGPDGETPTPAEELIRKNSGIGLLILPEAPEDAEPAASMTDKTGRKIPVLREAEDAAGCVLQLSQTNQGGIVCDSAAKLTVK